MNPAYGYRRVWQVSWPIILSNLSIPLVGAVDTAVVGHLPDPVYLGAVGLGAVIFSFLFWGFGFLRMGTTGFTAQAWGRGNLDQVRATLLRALLLAALLGSALVALQQPVARLAFHFLEGGPELESLAARYYQIRIWSAPATLANYAILGVLIGMQRTRATLLLQVLLNGSNVVLDLLLVSVLKQDVGGVALASVVSEYLAAGAGLVLLARTLPLNIANCRGIGVLDGKPLRALLQVNINIFLRSLCLIFTFFHFTAQGTRLGPVTLAANTVLMNLQHFLAYGLDGFAHATEALAGGAYGRADREGFYAVVKAATVWALVVAVGYMILFLVLGPLIVDAITGIEAVRREARAYLPWLIASPLLSVWSFQLDGIFIGATRTREMRNGMVIALLCYLLGVWTLVPTLGNHGLWLALMVFMVVRALTLGLWFPRLAQRFRDTG